MAFSVLKVLSVLIVSLFFFGLKVDCKVERYAFNIVENGTSFREEVDVDVENQTEVIRVPQHNNVNGVEVMNDFTAGISAFRYSARKACYVSKLDPSFPPPGQLKSDMDQASRQSSLPNNVTTYKTERIVKGFADRSTLPERILDFCGIFPIYEVEIKELNESLHQGSGRVRIKRNHKYGLMFNMCSHFDLLSLEHCLKTKGHNAVYEMCLSASQLYCYYVARCHHSGPYPSVWSYTCNTVLHISTYSRCCVPYC